MLYTEPPATNQEQNYKQESHASKQASKKGGIQGIALTKNKSESAPARCLLVTRMYQTVPRAATNQQHSVAKHRL